MMGYRVMVEEDLRRRFPETEFTFVNAGISSTCSTTGAHRLTRDVLSTRPDLLFVEFAVNDDQDASHPERECRRGMEGILRQARVANSALDIVVTHFVNPPMLELLKQKKIPVSSGAHEAVAAHYGVSTIDLAREVVNRLKAYTNPTRASVHGIVICTESMALPIKSHSSNNATILHAAILLKKSHLLLFRKVARRYTQKQQYRSPKPPR